MVTKRGKQMEKHDFDSYRDEILRVGRIVAGELVDRSDEPGPERGRQPYDAQERERIEPAATV